MGAPLPPQTETLLASPAPRPTVPRTGLGYPMPGLEHSLRRSPSSLPCRGPWQTTPRTRAAREQLERLEQLPPDYLPQNPAPAQPRGASGSPRARPAPQGQASAPPARPGTLGRSPEPQAHLQCVKSACSPPPDQRLRSAGLARPAQPLSSVPRP